MKNNRESMILFFAALVLFLVVVFVGLAMAKIVDGGSYKSEPITIETK